MYLLIRVNSSMRFRASFFPCMLRESKYRRIVSCSSEGWKVSCAIYVLTVRFISPFSFFDIISHKSSCGSYSRYVCPDAKFFIENIRILVEKY